MKCVIIYHSKFGNNKQLCEALSKDLEKDMEVKCLFVDEASVDDVKAADLVIIGGPTHILRASRSMRKFLKELSKRKEEFAGKKAIAYGTKVKMGSAAKSIEKRLKKMGFDVIMDPVDFYVSGQKGPFKGGEIERMIAHVREAIS